jgi:hypothetical protein
VLLSVKTLINFVLLVQKQMLEDFVMFQLMLVQKYHPAVWLRESMKSKTKPFHSIWSILMTSNSLYDTANSETSTRQALPATEKKVNARKILATSSLHFNSSNVYRFQKLSHVTKCITINWVLVNTDDLTLKLFFINDLIKWWLISVHQSMSKPRGNKNDECQ